MSWCGVGLEMDAIPPSQLMRSSLSASSERPLQIRFGARGRLIAVIFLRGWPRGTVVGWKTSFNAEAFPT
jgi:hypothetical protein